MGDRTRTIGRRAVLGGAVGGAAAVALRGLVPNSAAAANGDPLILGSDQNTAAKYTLLKNSETPGTYAAFASHGQYGVLGVNATAGAPGVLGQTTVSNGIGVLGKLVGTVDTSTVAVKGQTGGHNSQVGVDGDARDGLGEGIAVRARTKNGIGIYTEATGGYALQAVGRAVFSRSGKLTFAAGTASKTISGIALTASSLVLATIQGNVAGTWVRGVTINTSSSSFTIRLNRAAPSSLVVGYFVVN